MAFFRSIWKKIDSKITSCKQMEYSVIFDTRRNMTLKLPELMVTFSILYHLFLGK